MLAQLAKRLNICTTPPFLIALTLLLLNDFYLKLHHLSWLTGKLSDFAGLIVLPLLVFCLAAIRVRLSAWLLAVLFVWWKSPASQFLIDAVNATQVVHIGRVVDYTDLVALVAIPYAVRFFEQHERSAVSRLAFRRMLAIASFSIAILAVMATSVVPYTRHFVVHSPGPEKVLSSSDVEEVLDSLARRGEPECNELSSPREGTRTFCHVNDMWVEYAITDEEVQFRVSGDPPSLIRKGRRTIRRVDRFVEELNEAFGKRIDSLDLIEIDDDDEYRLQ